MNWFREHRKILILLLVVAIAVAITAVSAFSGGDSAASGAGGNFFGKISQPFSTIGRNFSSFFGSGDLKKENEQLKKENEQLRREVQQNALSQNELTELKDLKKALKYADQGKSGKYISATITSMDGTSYMNVFTVNVGSKDGVKEGDLVIAGKGIVGRVKSVGPNWAKVVTLLDSTMNISFQVNGNPAVLGVLNGSDGKLLSGYTLSAEAKIAEGDTLVTSGLGTIPAGIPIGKVTRVRYDSNEQLLNVTVRAGVDFNSLREVMVLL